MIMPYLVRLINNLFARNKKNNMTQDSKLEVVSGDTGFRSSSAYSNYVLGILFVVYVFNFVDRQIMSVFIGPIKAEFGVSDTAMGLLVGFAFALLYTVVGIPIARWADSGNRRNIIALGLAVWSAMTVFSGLARSFATLAIARVGVGVGEAAGSPPAHSLIADYFPLNRRATALAVYASGAFVGSGIAYLGGGYLREYFDWRTAFIVVGAPGILLVSLFFFAPFYVLLNIYIPAMYAANQALAKLRMRATASAIMLFMVNIVGAGLGPLVVGMLSDYFSPQFGVEAIRYALLVSLGLGVIGCVLLLMSSRFYEEGVLKTRPKKT